MVKKTSPPWYTKPVPMAVVGVLVALFAYVLFMGGATSGLKYDGETIWRATTEMKDYAMNHRFPTLDGPEQHTAPPGVAVPAVATAISQGLSWYFNHPPTISHAVPPEQKAIAKETILLYKLMQLSEGATKTHLREVLRVAVDYVCKSWEMLGGDANAFFDTPSAAGLLYVMGEQDVKCASVSAKDILATHFLEFTDAFQPNAVAGFVAVFAHTGVIDEEAFVLGIKDSPLKVALADDRMSQAMAAGNAEKQGESPGAEWMNPFSMVTKDLAIFSSVRGLSFLSEDERAKTTELLRTGLEFMMEEGIDTMDMEVAANIITVISHFGVGVEECNNMRNVIADLLDFQNDNGSFGDVAKGEAKLDDLAPGPRRFEKAQMNTYQRVVTLHAVWALTVATIADASCVMPAKTP